MYNWQDWLDALFPSTNSLGRKWVACSFATKRTIYKRYNNYEIVGWLMYIPIFVSPFFHSILWHSKSGKCPTLLFHRTRSSADLTVSVTAPQVAGQCDGVDVNKQWLLGPQHNFQHWFLSKYTIPQQTKKTLLKANYRAQKGAKKWEIRWIFLCVEGQSNAGETTPILEPAVTVRLTPVWSSGDSHQIGDKAVLKHWIFTVF